MDIRNSQYEKNPIPRNSLRKGVNEELEPPNELIPLNYRLPLDSFMMDNTVVIRNVNKITGDDDEVGILINPTEEPKKPEDVIRPVQNTPGNNTNQTDKQGTSPTPTPTPFSFTPPETDNSLINTILKFIMELLMGLLSLLGDLLKELFTWLIGDPKDLNFDALKGSMNVTGLFPFCIPFDIARMIENIQAPANPPRYEAEIMGHNWVVDFNQVQYLADVVRKSLFFAFIIGLMMATNKVIRW